VAFEPVVAGFEMIIAKESVISGKWRWVGRFKDEMLLLVDKFSFVARISAPEQEDEMRSFV
jgi:hypothetical protein